MKTYLLSSLSGFAVDVQGNLYMDDTLNRRIQRFDSNGTLLDTWAGKGQFNMPIGIAVDGQGNIYVSDYANSRVQKFRLVEN